MTSSYTSDTLTGPFIGYVIGTVFFGITILQTFQFVTYPENNKQLKSKVFLVCLLDAVHFVFSSNLMYTFFISNFDSVIASTRNAWGFKAIAISNIILVVLVQLIYLERIHTLYRSHVVGKVFLRLIKSFIWFMVVIAVGVGLAVSYEVLNAHTILSLGNDSELMIYLGFGTTTILDMCIALMMCLVLHKEKVRMVAQFNSESGDMKITRALSTLIKYAFASGFLTAFISLLVIISFVAQPNSLVYIGVALSGSRLYPNSLLAMFNLRGRLNDQFLASPDVEKVSGQIVFDQRNSTVTYVFSPGGSDRLLLESTSTDEALKLEV